MVTEAIWVVKLMGWPYSKHKVLIAVLEAELLEQQPGRITGRLVTSCVYHAYKEWPERRPLICQSSFCWLFHSPPPLGLPTQQTVLAYVPAANVLIWSGREVTRGSAVSGYVLGHVFRVIVCCACVVAVTIELATFVCWCLVRRMEKTVQ